MITPAAAIAGIYEFPKRIAGGLSADTSLLLNLSPDHIDRHGTMQNYAAVK